MTINLSRQREQIVLSLLRAGKFASADAVIDEALRLVGQRYHEPVEANQATAGVEAGDALDHTRQQLENLRRLGRKLEAMPVEAVADGLSNRDHDQILYGQ